MWMSIQDAAKKLGKSRQTIYLAAYKGTLNKRIATKEVLEVEVPDEEGDK